MPAVPAELRAAVQTTVQMEARAVVRKKRQSMKGVNTTEYLQKLAEECLRDKRYNDAVLLYRKLVDMRPGEESFLLALAWAYHDAGMRKDAVDCFDQLLNMELGRKVFTGFAFDELVRILKEEEDYERLVEICERVVTEQPDDVGLLSDLGDAYLKSGRYDSAVGVFEKMAGMEPDASMIFCSLGNALIAKEDFTGAEKAYRKAVEIDPSETGTFYARLAGVYFEAGHVERAGQALGKCIEYSADEPAYHCRLGDVLIRQGRLKDAEIAYEKAIALNRDDAGAYYNRFGNALVKAGCHLQAIEIFKKAIAADPRNPFYPLRLAEAHTAAGLSDTADKD
jgi:tetratricopeptide (TPR) repeat protein